MKINDLRKLDNEELIKKLQNEQEWYNKWFDANDEYFMDVRLRNMNKIKKVFNERNIKIEFINGWEIIK